MKFIKLESTVINLDLVAFAERTSDGRITLHFAIPHAIIPAGATESAFATDHFCASFTGEGAKKIWDGLNAI
jgi:hypothetical protein